MSNSNNNLILICGNSATGKSASLRDIKNPKGVIYLNTECNKKLPFKSGFKEYNITDPFQVYEAFDHAETLPEIHTIIIDSLTFLMDQYETQYVLTAVNTMKAWGDFQQYFKRLMQDKVANSTKTVIFLAHTKTIHNEEAGTMEVLVPVKGSLANNGIESYFSTVISSKRVSLKDLAGYKNDLLTITPDEEEVKFKYCYQTRLTQKTVNERIRAPMGMFAQQETYIDNNAQLLIDRLHEYYEN